VSLPILAQADHDVSALNIHHPQAYFEKGPARVYNLRPDSLAIMLSLGNVAAGAKVVLRSSLPMQVCFVFCCPSI